MRIPILILSVFLAACTPAKQKSHEVYLTGRTSPDSEYLTIGKDTIYIEQGIFSDTINRDEDQYNYLKLDSWKWPRIVHLGLEDNLNLDFQNEWVEAESDTVNTFLLNKDSILSNYSARWDMADSAFRATWEKEFPANMAKIDTYFAKSNTPAHFIEEIKQMEYMLRGHLTANFISFQEGKGLEIDRSIYDFVEEIDLNNERLEFHENNRNFQYYYYLDKVDEEIPGSIYPFAAIDTVNKYVKLSDIKNMIIRSVVKSGLYSEEVDHQALIDTYEKNIGEVKEDDRIYEIYDQILKLKPGNMAPGFGRLESLNGDSISLRDLPDSNILLSAWGTWCPHCREELPHLKRLINSYSDKLVSVGISLDSDRQKWETYMEGSDWEGIHLRDPKRGSAFRKNYLISGTNVYYLIDRYGKIVTGKLKPSSLELEELIQGLE